MLLKNLALSDDLSIPLKIAAIVLCLAWWAFLFYEVRSGQPKARRVLLSGLGSGLLLTLMLLRPEWVESKGTEVGAKVAVLVDHSRRLLLPAEEGTRAERAEVALDALSSHLSEARIETLAFGGDKLKSLSKSSLREPAPARASSDLAQALEQLEAAPVERPQAVIVISDGRLGEPGEEADRAQLRARFAALGAPIHTVRLSDASPRDASVRRVLAAGTAVAHEPLSVTVEVGCSGLVCEQIPITIQELLQGEPPRLLAQGRTPASSQGDLSTVTLSITLERAGPRVLEVSIQVLKK
jgi:hypothetical protein